MTKNFLAYSFILILVGVFLAGLQEDKKIDETENRTLKELPKLDGNFPEEAEEYVNDHFGFRDEFVALNQFIKKDIFKQGVTDEVIQGKDGYLFYKKSIRLYEGNLNQDKVDEYILNLQNFANEHKNKKIYFFLIPNKTYIFDEYLPDWVKKSDQRSYIKTKLQEVDNIKFIDLYDDLKNNEKPTFLKTDTHWNGWGGYIAYSKIIDVLKRSGVWVNKQKTKRIYEEEGYVGDLAKILGLGEEVSEVNLMLELGNNRVRTSSAIIVHDSFYDLFLDDMMKKSFSNIHLTSSRNFEDVSRLTKLSKANSIIFIIVDRHILAK